jgi:hypothetical protein
LALAGYPTSGLRLVTDLAAAARRCPRRFLV